MGQNVKETMVAGPLQNVSIAYRNSDYIADRVFPILDGSDPRAKVYVYNKGQWFRDEAGIRAPGTRARRGKLSGSNVSISTDEYAFGAEVTDEDRRFAKSKNAPPLQPDMDAIEFATDKIDLKKERRVAASIFAGTWADGNAGGADAEGLWSPNDSSNTFLADITTGKKAIRANAGVKANCLAVDYATFLALKELAAIKDRIKYTSRDSITPELLAKLLELDEVLVGEAVYSDAEETAAGDDFNAVNIWEANAGKGGAFLFYRPKKLGLKVLTAGMQVRIAYEDGLPRRVTTWREAAEHQDVYEAAEETDILQVSPACGYLWTDTYAS